MVRLNRPASDERLTRFSAAKIDILSPIGRSRMLDDIAV